MGLSQGSGISGHEQLKALKDAIKREVDMIPLEVLERVMTNFRERVQHCIDEQGRQLKNFIFKA